MKKTPSYLIAFAMLVLAASGMAVAQSDMGNASTSGATFATGIVETFGTNSVTLKKDDGASFTVMLDNGTVGKAFLANGSRVRINYRTNDTGQTVAQVIEINGPNAVAVAPKVEVDTQVAMQEPATTYKPIDTYKAAPAAPIAPKVAETHNMDTMDTDRTPDTLPATAGRMPTFALLGLLALAGGLAIRIAR